MHIQSLKRTLLLYLSYAWLISSVLSAIVLLAEYSPSTQKAIERFGIGALLLDCIAWELLFTVSGSLSLLNVFEPIRNNFFMSLIFFMLLPVIAMIIVLMIKQNIELFGIAECSITFLVTQLFFFFRFRSCLKKTNLPSNKSFQLP